jgi:hypothetical protein
MADLTGIGSLFEFGTAVINRIWPDAQEAEKAKLAVLLAEIDVAHRERVAQIETNTAQAQNSNLFVSGARPALLWCCVLIFAYSYIIYPTAVFIVALCDASLVVPRLALDEAVWNLIFGLLGLGLIGARSVEKVKGVAK